MSCYSLLYPAHTNRGELEIIIKPARYKRIHNIYLYTIVIIATASSQFTQIYAQHIL